MSWPNHVAAKEFNNKGYERYFIIFIFPLTYLSTTAHQSIYTPDEINQLCVFHLYFKQDASEAGRMCPRCNNAAVVGGSSRTWFEFFWVPLIPFSKSRIWVCSICQWEMKMGDGPDPQPPQAHGWGGGRPPPPNQFHQPGYGQQHV